LERVEVDYTAGGPDKVKLAGEIIVIGLKGERNGFLNGL
jgi:hypothetical protein